MKKLGKSVNYDEKQALSPIELYRRYSIFIRK